MKDLIGSECSRIRAELKDVFQREYLPSGVFLRSVGVGACYLCNEQIRNNGLCIVESEADGNSMYSVHRGCLYDKLKN